jgi:hypothetical protein
MNPADISFSTDMSSTDGQASTADKPKQRQAWVIVGVGLHISVMDSWDRLLTVPVLYSCVDCRRIKVSYWNLYPIRLSVTAHFSLPVAEIAAVGALPREWRPKRTLQAMSWVLSLVKAAAV